MTDAVIEEVKLWQNRPLEELYPIVYLDALMVKVRDEGHIQNKAMIYSFSRKVSNHAMSSQSMA